jgi:hypothetical protein
MEKTKQVLIVTNAITEDEVLKIKDSFSSEYAPKLNVNLSLVHVIPRLPTCYFNIPSMGMLIEKYYDEAKESLNQVGSHLGIDKNDQWLISGKVRTEVLRLANKLGSNFMFFKNINQYALIKTINQLETL